MNSSHFFFFGGYPQLSLAELKALIPESQIELIKPNLAGVAGLSPNHLKQLQKRLGGTLKISRFISKSSFPDLSKKLTEIFTSSTSRNLALTNYGNLDLPADFLVNLKNKISRPVRFLSFGTEPHSLVALRKQHVLEINIHSDQESSDLVLTQTVWIQDSDQWAKLDRRRPYQDIKRGMLPPKIARIMVNLATGSRQDGFLADPFCGTGTIALEAARLGYRVFASDLDSKAVQGTQANLSWLVDNFSVTADFQVKHLDAVHLNRAVSSLDFIVTEPFMGSLLGKNSNLSLRKLKNNIKGLSKLYLGALKNWRSIISKEGRVVMIFPEFHLFDRVWPLPLIDTCEKLGYNKLAQLSYSKPQAKVVRKIVILQKYDH